MIRPRHIEIWCAGPVILFLLALAAFDALAQPAEPVPESEARYNAALAFFREGKTRDTPMQDWLRNCEDQFQAVIDDFPGSDPAFAALYCRSLCQSRQQRYEVAIDGLETYCANPRENVPLVPGLTLLADCLTETRALERANGYRELVLNQYPKDAAIPDVLYALGRDLRDLGKIDEAKECWVRLKNAYPKHEAAARAETEKGTMAQPRARLAPLKAELAKLVSKLRPKSTDEDALLPIQEVLVMMSAIPGKETEEAIFKALNSCPKFMRPVVAPSLMKVASPANVESILAKLNEYMAETQVEILTPLDPCQLEGLSLEKLLAPWIAEGVDGRIRTVLFRLLSRIGTVESTKLLLEGIEPRMNPVLADLSSPRIAPLARAIADVRHADAIKYVAEYARDAREPVIRRLACLVALAHIKDDSATAALTAVVEEKSAAILTLVAIDGLKRRKVENAAESILRGIRNHPADAAVRLAGVEALLGFRAALPSETLFELGNLDDIPFRCAWVKLLALHAHREECYEKLLAMLADPAWQVREVAIMSVGKLRRIESIDALVARFAVEQAALAALIRTSLADLAGTDYGADPLVWNDRWKAERASWQATHSGSGAGAGDGVAANGPKRHTAVYFGVECGKGTVFLIDGSASMRTLVTIKTADGSEAEVERMKLARDELASALANLHEDAQFLVVLFQDKPLPLWQGLHRVEKNVVRQTNDHLKAFNPAGTTNVFDSLELAMGMPGVDTIFLLTDGEPTAGKERDPDKIVDAIFAMNKEKKIAIHTIALGEDSVFLSRLARLNFGRYVSVGSVSD